MRAFDTDGGAAMIAEGFRAHYNLVKPHMGIGSATPGDAAGVVLPNGFRWKAILNAAITRSVTPPPRVRVKSNHPIRGQSLIEATRRPGRTHFIVWSLCPRG